jgi:outer membrane immunogenic protein
VFGVEADWSWNSAKTTFVDDPNNPLFNGILESKLKSFGTARTRTGIVVDDVMLYVTGGFAWGNVNNTYATQPAPFNEQFSFNTTRWGWTVGAGSEWKFAGNWTLKSEVLYMQLKQQQDTFVSPVQLGNTFRFTNNDSAVVARMGINYIFGARAY